MSKKFQMKLRKIFIIVIMILLPSCIITYQAGDQQNLQHVPDIANFGKNNMGS